MENQLICKCSLTNFQALITYLFHSRNVLAKQISALTVLQFIFIVSCFIPAKSFAVDTTAKELFSDFRQLVYQIRVIDIASGDKYSIGSGFSVSADGHIVTNFHVISSFVHEPDKYRLEYIQQNGAAASLKLLAIDVIHDLAIVKSAQSGGDYFKLSTESLDKGNRIYSMGNPQDLGMTIIEGTFNGLVKLSRYRKILFSGSLNAGMSGGPTINERGEVIGVNVSKGGEQLSFLVPVNHVANLLERAESSDLNQDFAVVIRDALLKDQELFYQLLLDAPMDLQPFGELFVPGRLSDFMKCWGHTVDEEEIKYEAVHRHCRSEDEIYVSGDLYVGNMFYDYEWITTEELNRFQFYHFLQDRFSHGRLNNAYDETDVTDFRCHDRFMNMDSGSWKISSCFRAYEKYEGLYDALLLMISMEENDKSLIFKVGASGVSSDNAQAFFRRMVEAIQWKH